MTFGWFNLAVLSLLLLGSQRFLYKVSAERQCNTAWTTFSFMGTVSILSTSVFVVSKTALDRPLFLLFISFVNSAAFLTATMTHIEALKNIPTSVAYPIIRLNAVIVVLFGIFYFNDRLTRYQAAGILLAMAVMIMLTREVQAREGIFKKKGRGMAFVFISMMAGAVASISSKFAALHTDTVAFIAVSYIMSTVFSYMLKDRMETDSTKKNHREALFLGVVMGLVNFGGYYSFLKALSTGPLSIVVSITGMHFVISVTLSAIIFHEKLTPLRVIGVCMTVLSIVLLRH